MAEPSLQSSLDAYEENGVVLSFSRDPCVEQSGSSAWIYSMMSAKH